MSQGYIYILSNPAFEGLKIGFSNNVSARITSLNTSVPYNFVLECRFKVKYDLKTEHEVQKRLSYCRINREFFKLTVKEARDLVGSLIKEIESEHLASLNYIREEVEYPEDIVDILIQQRKDLGVNQKDLSQLCNLSENGISKMENKRGDIKLSTLFKLSKLLGIKVVIYREKV